MSKYTESLSTRVDQATHNAIMAIAEKNHWKPAKAIRYILERAFAKSAKEKLADKVMALVHKVDPK